MFEFGQLITPHDYVCFDDHFNDFFLSQLGEDKTKELLDGSDWQLIKFCRRCGMDGDCENERPRIVTKHEKELERFKTSYTERMVIELLSQLGATVLSF